MIILNGQCGFNFVFLIHYCQWACFSQGKGDEKGKNIHVSKKNLIKSE
jgi:hypothetical protein